jgi:hypothetical protein
MATFASCTSLNRSQSLLQFHLKALAGGLPRQGANERAKRRVLTGATWSILPASTNPVPSAASRSWSSSFSHDTPAHPERRCRRSSAEKWAHCVRLPTHRHLTGVSPWQRDDLDDVLRGRSCAWPETEAQSDTVIGVADVTSHEQTTRKFGLFREF